MAVLSRLLIGSQQRVDLPDILAIESYVSSDFKNLIKSLVGTTPMVLKGFEIIDAPLSINTRSVSIRVADSVLYNPQSSAGSFFYGLQEGHPLAAPLVPDLRTNATNYVYLTLTSKGYAPDSRAFWDVDLNSGEGGEFNQIVNTQSVLRVEVGISVSTFPEGTIPIAKIEVGSSTITKITDCRNMMFRLGTGGVSPDQIGSYTFRSLPSASYSRDEPPISVDDSTSPTPFFGGDKNIFSLKEWMDAVMTKLLELSGTTYWYESAPTINLLNLFDDTVGSSIKSKGKWTHDGSTPGKVTWSEDIVYRKMNDPRDIIIRKNATTGKQLQNEEVMFIEMVRGKRINSLGNQVEFKNGAAYINGPEGSFEYLSKGDWIKKLSDNDNLYLRVEDFRASQNGTGSPTSANVAVSVILSGTYQGTTEFSSAVYTKGEYANDDIQIASRSDSEPWLLGGQFYWLANRSDTIEKIASITSSYKTGITIDNSDTKRAKITMISHGLLDGDRVVVANASSYNGTYQVEVESANVVIIETTGTFPTTSQTNATVSWAVVTTAARSTDYGYELESANHSFESNQTVVIENTGSLYDSYNNGRYLINVRSDTQFQIPYNANTAVGAIGTASCARINLRTEFGAARVIQGESLDINEPDSKNILNFIGMTSLAQNNPAYFVPNGYGTLEGFENFNSSPSDSLTERVSKLTSMMADRVQDRSSIVGNRVVFRNETSGSNQILTPSGGDLFIEKPGSLQQTIVISNFTLPTNSAVVATVGREVGTSITPVVESLYNPYLLEENKIILFYRFSGTSVYSWDGVEIKNSSSWTSNDHENAQNKNITLIDKAGVAFCATTSSAGYIYYRSPSTSAEITISMNGSSITNKIDAYAINQLTTAQRTISDGQSVWLRINRAVAKTFNNIQTSSTYQDTDANGSLYITSKSDVPVDEDVFVIYTLENLGLVTTNHSQSVGNIYEENYEVTTTISSGSEIVLPNDTRNNNELQLYIKGSGQLEVYLNGQKLVLGTDWTEPVVTANYDTTNKIIIQQNLVIGDVLTFRIASSGGVYFAETSNFATLQSAYNAGSLVTIASGDPIVLNAGSNTALQITGKLEIGNVDFGDNFNLNVEGSSKFSSPSKDVVIEDGKIKLYESNSSSSYIGLSAPSSVSSNITFSLPNSYGTNGQILSTNGSGSLFWASRNPVLAGEMSSSSTAGSVLTVDPLVYRSFIGHVSVFVASSNLAETFHLIGSNNGLTWKMSQASGGDSANVSFTINNSGILSFSDPAGQSKVIKYDLSLMPI